MTSNVADKKTFFKIVLISFVVLFFSWFVVNKLGVNKLTIQSEDTLPALFLPVTILKEGTFYVDTYYDMLLERYPAIDDQTGEKGDVPFYLREVRTGGSTHYISAFPVISGLVAIPVYAIPLAFNMPITWDNLEILSHITSALIMALSGGFLYLLLKKQFVLTEKRSLLLTFTYLFGTINFAHISQALWQHGTVQFFSILGLYFLMNGLRSKTRDSSDDRTDGNVTPNLRDLFLSGLFLGIAVLSRPTAALSFMALYILIYFANDQTGILGGFRSLRNLISASTAYVMGLVPVVAFFLWYNRTFYLSLDNQGYSDQLDSSWLSPFPEGFLGLWLSPSKGILVYSPVFIMIFVSLYLVFKQLRGRTSKKPNASNKPNHSAWKQTLPVSRIRPHSPGAHPRLRQMETLVRRMVVRLPDGVGCTSFHGTASDPLHSVGSLPKDQKTVLGAVDRVRFSANLRFDLLRRALACRLR
jgi:hypothetical protein